MRGIPEEGPKPDVSARDRLASWFRVSKVLLSFLLLSLAGSIAIPVLALNYQPEEPDTAQTTCLGAGYTISVVWSDSSQTRAQWQDRNYSDISLSSLHKELVDRIRSLHIFSGIVDRSDDPHDFDLVINIERLQRRPISSPDDLWLESSFALVWRTYRQSLWTGRYGISLEAREVAFPNTSPPALHLLMVRAAASKLAFRMGNDLKRFLSGDGLAKLAETRSAPCAARTVLRVRVGDISS